MEEDNDPNPMPLGSQGGDAPRITPVDHGQHPMAPGPQIGATPYMDGSEGPGQPHCRDGVAAAHWHTHQTT